MKRILLAVTLLFLYSTAFAQVPTIVSFSPASGPAGTSVTISGSNFSTTTTGNTVFFGAVKATVTSATSNSLNVTVPTGATFQPITVTTNGLTAFSASPFALTYPDGGSIFSLNTSFNPATSLPIGTAGSTVAGYVASADFDGDGKPDLAVAESAVGGVYLFKNTGSQTTPFANKQDLLLSNLFGAIALNVADYDGDGKPDIAVVISGGRLSIFKNTSTGGVISFATAISYTAGSQLLGLATGDLDGDGKPDIAISYNGNSVLIFKNTSTAGAISFAADKSLLNGQTCYGIVITDLDGDGKPEIVTTNHDVATISVYKNNSTAGTISMAAKQDIVVDNSPWALAVADIDGDGKNDLVITNHMYFGNINTGEVLKNTSTAGSISFAAKVNFSIGANEQSVAIADLDGDGKPDIAVADYDTYNCTIIKNNSTPGTVTIQPYKSFAAGNFPHNIIIGDVNGDNKPDMAIANASASTVSEFINVVNPLNPFITSFTPTKAGAGQTVAITGTHFDGTTAVSFGGHAATSFSVVSSTSITAVVAPSSVSGTILVTTPVGVGNTTGFVFIFPPGIGSFTKSASGSNTQVVIKGLYFTGTTALTFDGVPAISYTVNTDNQVTAIIAASTFKNISLTTPGGTYIYTVPAAPVITSLSVSTGGPGTTVVITGTSFTGATSVKFGNILASTFTVNSPTTITAVVGTSQNSSTIVSVTTPLGTNIFTGFQYNPPPTISSFSPLTAKAGDAVTINGTNFTSATSVTFGNTAAQSFTINSATKITAIVGSGTSGVVAVTTPSGRVTLSGFIFNAPPPPIISSFSPIAAGAQTQVTITGSNFTGPTAVTFGGTPAQSFTVVSATSITAVVGAGSGGYISITTPNGTVQVNGFTYVPKPAITANGPLTFALGGNVILSTATVPGYSYKWSKDGTAIPGATNASYTATISGQYSVTITIGGYTVTADAVNVSVIFTLPATNFNISVTSATCKGQLDGIINITAAQALNYTATITRNSLNKPYAFTNNVAITGLSAGTYNVCLTVQGQANYSQCFTLVITEPKDLSLFSTVNKSSNMLTLDLSGGNSYNVQLNGVTYTTSNNSITLPLSKGSNSLSVSTDKFCQGVIERIINISGNKAPYPNPFQNILYLNLGDLGATSGTIKIYNIADGKLVLSKKYADQSGVMRLDVTSLDNGAYTLLLVQGDTQTIFKIIKK